MANYIASLNISNYGSRNPHGSITVTTDYGSLNIQLDKEDAEKIFEIAYKIIEDKIPSMAKAVAETQLQPLLGYDSSKTIDTDDEEIPF